MSLYVKSFYDNKIGFKDMVSFKGVSDDIVGALIDRDSKRFMQYTYKPPVKEFDDSGWRVRVSAAGVSYNSKHVDYIERAAK